MLGSSHLPKRLAVTFGGQIFLSDTAGNCYEHLLQQHTVVGTHCLFFKINKRTTFLNPPAGWATTGNLNGRDGDSK